ncbi:MAG TPA: hypothetical protein V6C58_00425, partial [Allocoleopsis sp.]
NRIAKQKQIKKIKSGLYYIVPLDNENFYPDKIHIASKLIDESIITGPAALKILNTQAGIQPNIQQTNDTIYILSKNQSKKYLDKQIYRTIKSNTGFGILKTQYQTNYTEIEIKLTDLERTIIECIKTRSIKAQDMINMIRTRQNQQQFNIDIKKIQTYLEKYNINILYNKIGLILEVCSPFLKIEKDEIEKLRKKLTKKIYYYKEPGLRLMRPKYEYYKEWNIMITKELHDLIKSIRPVQSQTIQG